MNFKELNNSVFNAERYLSRSLLEHHGESIPTETGLKIVDVILDILIKEFKMEPSNEELSSK
jgi:hypothetical protein